MSNRDVVKNAIMNKGITYDMVEKILLFSKREERNNSFIYQDKIKLEGYFSLPKLELSVVINRGSNPVIIIGDTTNFVSLRIDEAEQGELTEEHLAVPKVLYPTFWKV